MRTIKQFVLAALLGCLSFVVCAQAYVEGKHYQLAPKNVNDNELVQELMKEAKGKVQVLEFFSYGCSWCHKLDPYFEQYLKSKPSYVEFQRIPVEFHPAWAPLSKAYFTQVDLKLIPKTHTALFDEVSKGAFDKSIEDSLRDFFAKRGVKPEDFTKTFTSFDVTRKQKWANAISKGYRITAIPAVIVQGPAGIYITTGRMAGGEAELIKVVEYLADMQYQAYNIPMKKPSDAPKTEAKLN